MKDSFSVIAEEVKRLTPTKETLVRLFAKSGNKCAFETCNHKLFAEDGTFIAEVCHIEAAMTGGERFRPNMTNDERRQEENLILLCHAHHKISDNVVQYKPDKLKEIKRTHEAKFTSGGSSINLTDSNLNSIINKYEEELSRLLEILSKLVHFKKPEKEFSRLKANYRPSIQQFENNLNFFVSSERKIIQSFTDNFQTNKNKTGLLLGAPSSGKTTLALGISRQLYEFNFECYFLELNHELSKKEIIQELLVISKNKSLIIVDDIQKNLSLAIDIYSELEELPNISALFLSRKLSADFQIDDNGINLFSEIKLKYELQAIQPKEKFEGIIEAFRKHFNISQRIGDINKVLALSNHNILKLNLLLEFWKTNQEKKLEELTEEDFNRELFIRYLKQIEGNIHEIIPYCCINSYGIDFHFLHNRELCEQFQETGLIYETDTKNKLFSFGHSQFAELILESIINRLPQFDFAKYRKEENDFKTKQIIAYYKQFSTSSQIGFPYPKNTAEIFSSLHQLKVKGAIVALLNEKEISDKVLSYLQSEQIELSAIKDFFKSLRFCYVGKFEYFAQEYLEKSNYFKQMILSDRDGFQIFSFLLICCYKCNLSKEASKLISLLTDEELNQILKVSPINVTTLTTRLFKNYNPNFCNRIIQCLSESDWAEKFMQPPPFIASNSLTEFKQINRTAARNIFLQMDESQLGINLARLKFFYIEKTLSEFNEIDPDKAKKLFEFYSDERMLAALNKCKPSQLGKGLVSLHKVNPEKVVAIYLQLNSKTVASILKTETTKNALRIFNELHKISETKTKEILDEYFSDFSESEVKDITDWFTLIHSLKNLNYSDRATVFSKLTKEKLLPLFKKASVENYSSGLAAIKEYNSDLAKTIFQETNIDLNDNAIGFSSLGIILLKLRTVDFFRSQTALRNCDRNILVRKVVNNNINFGQIIKTIEELKVLDSTQAIEIFGLVLKEPKCQAKIYKLPFDQLLHTIISIHKINPDISKETFNNYKTQHKNDLLQQNIDFLNFSQGLSKFSRLANPLSLQILDKFFNKLQDQLPGLKFHELATGLSEIATFSIENAKKLLDTCSTEMLVRKAQETKAVTLNGALGEIKKIDTIRWAELIKQLK